MRNGKGRFTRDLDLARSKRWDSGEELTNNLKELVQGKKWRPLHLRSERYPLSRQHGPWRVRHPDRHCIDRSSTRNTTVSHL
ncbi:hypothetical protein [Corynebacterium sp. HMSC22B11]|uniref:hypothetical protein n=1 Tax=Corynebacterium sp. HMSC22B11 TaxID=1581056 RepID=UPI0021106C8B|nr:hypothetical protein [Corynebacterium sp. HMSC22B11]